MGIRKQSRIRIIKRSGAESQITSDAPKDSISRRVHFPWSGKIFHSDEDSRFTIRYSGLREDVARCMNLNRARAVDYMGNSLLLESKPVPATYDDEKLELCFFINSYTEPGALPILGIAVNRDTELESELVVLDEEDGDLFTFHSECPALSKELEKFLLTLQRFEGRVIL